MKWWIHAASQPTLVPHLQGNSTQMQRSQRNKFRNREVPKNRHELLRSWWEVRAWYLFQRYSPVNNSLQKPVTELACWYSTIWSIVNLSNDKFRHLGLSWRFTWNLSFDQEWCRSGWIWKFQVLTKSGDEVMNILKVKDFGCKIVSTAKMLKGNLCWIIFTNQSEARREHKWSLTIRKESHIHLKKGRSENCLYPCHRSNKATIPASRFLKLGPAWNQN
jgi:hypothetical protein